MNVVVDASAVGSFLLEDQEPALVAAAREICRTETLFVPTIWRTEIASVLVKAYRQGRITLQERDDAARVADAVAAEAAIGGDIETEQLVDLAERHSLRAADATYLSLALRLAMPLLTSDKQLKRAATAAGVALVLS